MTSDTLRLHTAPWVVPVSAPPLPDGAVAVARGTIQAVGGLAQLRGQYPHAAVVAHPQAILTPALINGHTHLELSHLAALSSTPCTTSFTGWINRLLQLRDTLGATGELAEQAALQTAMRQYRSGASVLVDIGNTRLAHDLALHFPGELIPHREYLGLAASTLEKNLYRLAQESETTRCTGHAPYSTHPRLLQRLKERARSLGHVFPIHTAEPAAEGDMIREGRGELVDFVRQRGFWDHSFVPRGSGGSVEYLHHLGILDEQTLCVHAIHLAPEEIRILAGEGGKVCLCPGSNRYLGTGAAPVRALLDHGILPALGTDSLASNPTLSLWREMRLLAQTHPEVLDHEIFMMATRGGAEALGLDQRRGTLAAGKEADMLAVPLTNDLTGADQVYRFLVHAAEQMDPVRIHQ